MSFFARLTGLFTREALPSAEVNATPWVLDKPLPPLPPLESKDEPGAKRSPSPESENTEIFLTPRSQSVLSDDSLNFTYSESIRDLNQRDGSHVDTHGSTASSAISQSHFRSTTPTPRKSARIASKPKRAHREASPYAPLTGRPTPWASPLKKSASGSGYMCPVEGCGKTLAGNITRHIREVHLEEKRFICTVSACGKAYSRNYYLTAHQRRDHPDSVHSLIALRQASAPRAAPPLQIAAEALSSPLGSDRDRRSPTSVPEYESEEGDSEVVHRTTRSTARRETIGKIIHSSKLANVISSHGKTKRPHLPSWKLHICPVPGCTEVIPRDGVQRHMSISHSTNEPFACPVANCNRRFVRREMLAHHERAEHSAPAALDTHSASPAPTSTLSSRGLPARRRAPSSSTSASNAGKFTVSMLRRLKHSPAHHPAAHRHTPPPPRSRTPGGMRLCPEGCGRRLSGNIARHIRSVHRTERLYECGMPGCPVRFSRADKMMAHRRTVHGLRKGW